MVLLIEVRRCLCVCCHAARKTIPAIFILCALYFYAGQWDSCCFCLISCSTAAVAGDKIPPADKISFSHDNRAGISVSTKLGATLFGNVKQMVGTSSCYKSVCCTLTVFTVRAWILKLPLFCASVCMTLVFYALYSYVMYLSPVVMHYRNDTKSFFFFFPLCRKWHY